MAASPPASAFRGPCETRRASAGNVEGRAIRLDDATSLAKRRKEAKATAAFEKREAKRQAAAEAAEAGDGDAAEAAGEAGSGGDASDDGPTP